jgi:Domain of unknown function (DUF4249)
MRKPFRLLLALLLLASCTKDIDVELPETESRLVVEGQISVGLPPLVILTRTQNFFAPTDLASIAGIFVRDAVITVDDGTGPVVLDPVCSGSFPDSLLVEVALAVGLDPDLLANSDICIYTDVSSTLLGEAGKTYRLRVEADGKVATSITTIPQPIPLDSLWFRLAQQDEDDDTSGYIYARLTDPDTLGNAYRWTARRISRDASGNTEDPLFIAPFGSSFPDKFINGLTFDFFAVRGNTPFEEDDADLDNDFFRSGDTVVVRFLSIGTPEYDFYLSFENNVLSQGDLFSNPANAKSNISGGLGIWAGWAPSLDTVICQL